MTGRPPGRASRRWESAEGEGLRRVPILGVRVVAEPLQRVLDDVLGHLGRASSAPPRLLFPTGVHGVVTAQDDPAFRAVLDGAAYTVCDGMPLVYLARLRGARDAGRAFGPSVMLAVLERTSRGGARHFFYGGAPGVADELAAKMRERFPGLEVVGTWAPPFRELTPQEEDDVAARINASGADVVWVGLSTPKQERWAAAIQPRLDVKLICAVGAAFDYNRGAIRPAPAWMRRLALEWLFRLIQEPRRLWRRYLAIVPRFLWLAALEALSLGFRRGGRPAPPSPPA